MKTPPLTRVDHKSTTGGATLISTSRLIAHWLTKFRISSTGGSGDDLHHRAQQWPGARAKELFMEFKNQPFFSTSSYDCRETWPTSSTVEARKKRLKMKIIIRQTFPGYYCSVGMDGVPSRSWEDYAANWWKASSIIGLMQECCNGLCLYFPVFPLPWRVGAGQQQQVHWPTGRFWFSFVLLRFGCTRRTRVMINYDPIILKGEVVGFP